MKKECSICKAEFENHSAYANHIRWNHKDNTVFAKKISDKAKERNSKRKGPLIEELTNCRKCNKEIAIAYYKDKRKEFYHCSQTCANSRGPRTEEVKKLISVSLKKAWISGKFDHVDYVSNNPFFSSKKEREIVKHFKETFPNDEWKSGGHLRFEGYSITRDLYSDKLKVCFEYDGVWHFKDIHGQLADKQEKDAALEKWCINNNYRLIRLEENHFENFNHIENIIYNETDSITKIGSSYKH